MSTLECSKCYKYCIVKKCYFTIENFNFRKKAGLKARVVKTKILFSLWEAQELGQMEITMHVLPRESMNLSIYHFQNQKCVFVQKIKYMETEWNTIFYVIPSRNGDPRRALEYLNYACSFEDLDPISSSIPFILRSHCFAKMGR